MKSETAANAAEQASKLRLVEDLIVIAFIFIFLGYLSFYA